MRTNRIERLGWISLLLLPLAACITGVILITRKKTGTGAIQIVSALVLMSVWAGLIPLVLALL